MGRLHHRAGLLGLVVAALAGMGGVGRAAPLDDRVPADAIAYVGWAGADSQQGQYAQSNLKGILDASTIQDVINKQLPPLLDQAAARDPAGAKALERVQKGMGIAWHHPLAFYFRTLDMTNPRNPMPQMGLICDAGADAKTLADLLNTVIAENPVPPEVKLQIMRDGDVVYVTLGSTDTPADLKKNGGLAGAATYKAAMNNVKMDTPAIAAYGDVAKAMALIDSTLDKVPGASPEDKKKVRTAIDALGAKSLSQVAMTEGFDKKQWAQHSFLGISGPRKGIIAMMGDTPLSEAILSVVPQDASAFAAWKFDLHKMYTEARNLVGQIDPDAQKELDDGVARGGMMLNLDIDKDVFSALGDEWVFYRARITEGGNTMALVHKLKDGDTFAKSLAAIEKFANDNLQNSPVKVEKVKTAKTEVSTVAILQYSVAWTVKNGYLYVSTLEGIGGAIKQVENKAPAITASDAYKAARAALPQGVKPLSISYANPARIYPELRALGLGLLPFARTNGVAIPNDIFPDPDDVTKFMTPGATIIWSDAAGIHGAGNSAFPGAEMLGGAQVGPASPLVVAAGVAVLLPSLGKSRELANRSVDAANVRGLAQSCVVWAADNNDKMPDSLARLVASGQVSPKQLVSKRAGTPPLTLPDMPTNMENLSKEEFAKFAKDIDAHCDFVYLGAGTKNETDAGIIVLYEKPSAASLDGINVGFGDAHAEFVRWGAVEETFHATNAMLKKLGKPEVDVRAMMRAAGAAVPPSATPALRDLP